MRDLEIYSIPLDKIVLERLNPNDKVHKKAILKMRDFHGKRMMFDIKQEFDKIKKNRDVGNSFLIKNTNNYIGYIFISNLNKNERAISMLIEKKMRNMGYGKIVLNSVSEYLFKENLLKSLKVYVKKNNLSSINMVKSCGFEEQGDLENSNTTIYQRMK